MKKELQKKHEKKDAITREVSNAVTQIAKRSIPPETQMALKRSSVKKIERFMKWEKNKAEKAVNQIIYDNATLLTNRLIQIGLEDGNPQAINSLLDRAFGRARQNIGLDGGEQNKPIIFMPAELMARHGINTLLDETTDNNDIELIDAPQSLATKETVIVHTQKTKRHAKANN